jgi:hydrogenase/urease accessory protein HupE
MPMPYVWGWVIVGVTALGLLLALGRALRDWDAPLVKALVGWWLAAVLVAPAQIPNHTDHLAPALFVWFFEAFLQRSGSPAAAGRILVAASVVGLVLGLAAWLVGRARRRRHPIPDAAA